MKLISDVIKPRDVYWVDAEDTVRQAVSYLCERKAGAVAVQFGDELVGVFSERDLLHRVVGAGLNPDNVKVRDVMSPDPVCIPYDDTVQMAKALMFKKGLRHLVVVGKGNQLQGLVSMRDLIEADMDDARELVQKLNDDYYEQAYRAKWRVSSNRVIIEPYELHATR